MKKYLILFLLFTSIAFGQITRHKTIGSTTTIHDTVTVGTDSTNLFNNKADSILILYMGYDIYTIKGSEGQDSVMVISHSHERNAWAITNIYYPTAYDAIYDTLSVNLLYDKYSIIGIDDGNNYTEPIDSVDLTNELGTYTNHIDLKFARYLSNIIGDYWKITNCTTIEDTPLDSLLITRTNETQFFIDTVARKVILYKIIRENFNYYYIWQPPG
jgi:hypothetical protein